MDETTLNLFNKYKDYVKPKISVNQNEIVKKHYTDELFDEDEFENAFSNFKYPQELWTLLVDSRDIVITFLSPVVGVLTVLSMMIPFTDPLKNPVTQTLLPYSYTFKEYQYKKPEGIPDDIITVLMEFTPTQKNWLKNLLISKDFYSIMMSPYVIGLIPWHFTKIPDKLPKEVSKYMKSLELHIVNFKQDKVIYRLANKDTKFDSLEYLSINGTLNIYIDIFNEISYNGVFSSLKNLKISKVNFSYLDGSVTPFLEYLRFKKVNFYIPIPIKHENIHNEINPIPLKFLYIKRVTSSPFFDKFTISRPIPTLKKLTIN